MSARVFSEVLCGFASALALTSLAWAQPYPVKPIRGVVGFPPGGATDILARQIAQKLSESFGQQVIIDNRAGGGGVIAAVTVRDAPADGYTLFFGTSCRPHPSSFIPHS